MTSFTPCPQTLLTHTPSSSKRAESIPPDEIIDREVFDQVLELGEDDPSFLRGMVDAYFEQAENTFHEMDVALCVFITPNASSP